ncbi:SDR family NAD(P)-dependent oxidoreductase [bacterium]|nr:SDR family NAD(P)-dependent oxidoreductase [bacterium]
MKIEQCTALVTGAASGLGEATTRALVTSGARVAMLDMDGERGDRISTELGDNVIFCRADISSESDLDQAIAAIKAAFGTLHIVVNCAGLGGSVKIVGRDGIMPMEMFTSRVNVNLIGTFTVIRAAAPLMMENSPNEEGERGVIINTASIAAFDGQVGQSAYASTKGGIVSMTLPLTREFAPNGIRVMAILPGIADTPLLAKNSPEVLDRLAKQVPFPPRLAKPSEFAALACHIVENPYLNGESIRLDGGLRMGFGRK